MTSPKPTTEELLRRAEQGDRSALEQLFSQYRDRLSRMINVRMDRRLAARVDSSDVIQDAFAEATRKLPGFLMHGDCPFYPWLRHIACEKLIQLQRRHVYSKRRSVTKEASRRQPVPDESVVELANQLVSSGTSPSGQCVREESRSRVKIAIDQLPEITREVVILRHLEQLTFDEIASVLRVSRSAAQSRYRRAVERLHALLKYE